MSHRQQLSKLYPHPKTRCPIRLLPLGSHREKRSALCVCPNYCKLLPSTSEVPPDHACFRLLCSIYYHLKQHALRTSRHHPRLGQEVLSCAWICSPFHMGLQQRGAEVVECGLFWKCGILLDGQCCPSSWLFRGGMPLDSSASLERNYDPPATLSC